MRRLLRWLFGLFRRRVPKRDARWGSFLHQGRPNLSVGQIVNAELTLGFEGKERWAIPRTWQIPVRIESMTVVSRGEPGLWEVVWLEVID